MMVGGDHCDKNHLKIKWELNVRINLEMSKIVLKGIEWRVEISEIILKTSHVQHKWLILDGKFNEVMVR